MFKETMKEIVKATQGAARRIGSPNRRLSSLRPARAERVIMWYGGQRAELTVDAWLRGH